MRKFKKFYIEITNVCNLACSFCPETKRQAGFMNKETFTNILDQIKPYTEYLYFHVKGEPLLHPELDLFLDISYEKGFKVNITTNGTLINQAKHKLLLKPALRQINFSLHSFDGNTINGKEVYINNILTFIKEIQEKQNIILSLRLWNLTKDNDINIKENKNRIILEMIEKEYNLSEPIKDMVTAVRGIKLADNIYLNHEHEFRWPDLKEAEDDGIGFCYGLRNQAAILVDGTVVPCCLDGEGIINLGNIHDTHFSEILKFQRAEDIYKGFSERVAVEELCRKCGYRKKFGVNVV
ncbi:radical SAM protein [Anaerocolumna sedimenticola]|uniref:Radical SAM protein n=1 Tax=Anaerocolumna sedimenticola TaxID=2696063 RepID=A0A6P1TKT9_9FIRM|nr:radical SAM/SPASM domain-containing protein [Anaerocolumna sedimenticola]QHQ61674.1 radical SAM protein [Anaerocolumna sedimenticola]